MVSFRWKSVLMFALACFMFTLFESGSVEAVSPEEAGLEAKMVLDFSDMYGDRLTNNRVTGLASNGEIYLFADFYGRLFRSENGLDWERVRETGAGVSFVDISEQLIWDGEQFVLLTNTAVLSSKDGREWNSHTPKHPDSTKIYVFNDVVYANGQYVILAQERDREVGTFYTLGDNAIFYGPSLDELKRAKKHDFIESIAGERPLEQLLWTGKRYVAGGNGSAYSEDGAVWHGGGPGGYEYNMVWDGRRIWKAYSNDIYSVSDTGDDYRNVYESPENAEHRVTLTSIGYNGRSYIAAGYGDTTTIVYSRDGVNWQRVLLDTEASDIHSIHPTPYGYLLAGNRVWYVSETEIESPSTWAVSELEQARENELVPKALRGFYQSPIMRKDFSVMSVRLYEALTNRWAEAPKNNPFRDTVHSGVLKANLLGIIKGKSTDRFAPDEHITRQDMAVILYRTLEAAGLRMSPEQSEWRADYTDIDEVASYAEEALRFMNQEGIIGGRSATRLDPTGTATREESIIMVGRMYERFMNEVESYTGEDSISETLLIVNEPAGEEDVKVVHRVLNLDGRFVWAGEVLESGNNHLYPLKELLEPLGVHAELDIMENKLTLSKSETDYVNQADTGISEASVRLSEPKDDTAVRHRMAFILDDSEGVTNVLVYQGKPYVSIQWFARTFDWKHRTVDLRRDPERQYDELSSDGVYNMYLYWDHDGFQSSRYRPALEIGERQIIRRDSGWNGRAELNIIGDDPSIVEVTPLETGWMLTGVKNGYCEVRVTNVDTKEHIYMILEVR